MDLNNISEVRRPAKSGKQMGKAIIEMVNLMYLDKNALCFLNTITKVLNAEFRRRKKAWRESQ